MDWKVEDAERVFGDLEAIFDHLVTNHIGFGHSLSEAIAMAERRIEAVRANRYRITTAPHRGVRHMYGGREFRHLTIDRAIYWFTIDETRNIVRVEAIFHGGQDHLGRMLDRLTREADGEGGA